VTGDRRDFLRAAMAGATWAAAADLLLVDEALAWAAGQSVGALATTAVLSEAEARVVDAVAARILPAVDGRPGAADAGVVHFIDRALSTFNASARRLYVEGIADLNRRARRGRPRAESFAALDPADQDRILRQVERGRFFQAVRADTIVGMFALPSWGGNRDFAGWRLLGFAHQPVFQPPFGYYDAEIVGKG
jgi:gluconate 2-dehydrogenase gamma chain